MTRIALPFPTASLHEAFSKFPAPWRIAHRWPLKFTGGDAAEIRDANDGHVLVCEAPLAEAILAAVHAAFLITPQGPLAPTRIEPWRGQEQSEPDPGAEG